MSTSSLDTFAPVRDNTRAAREMERRSALSVTVIRHLEFFAMRAHAVFASLLMTVAPLLAAAASPEAALKESVTSDQRSAEFRERDRYRHPLETLEFFGVKPDMTVVEIWPSSGWYSEILAPYLRDRGRYYAATPAASLPDASESTKKGVADLRDKFAAKSALYDKVVFTEFRPPIRAEIAPAGSADRVLTFRNVHNWVIGGFEQDAFKAFYTALKPGGVLGVVEHRAKPGTDLEGTKKSGYTTEAYVRTLAESAGFVFDGSSPVNDNPKDTKDYAEGVWTLPPTLRLGATDREKYLAIGESDRMTLRFVKPRVANK